MIEQLKVALGKQVRIIVVTRPVEDSKDEDRLALKNVLDLLEKNHISHCV